MSLLLDALKKAADDKQKLSRGGSTGSETGTRKVQSVNSSVRDEVRSIAKELKLEFDKIDAHLDTMKAPATPGRLPDWKK